MRFFLSQRPNFFLSVNSHLNWNDSNNFDMNRIRTQNVTCICSLWSNYSIERSYDVTSGLLPVLSDVKNSIPNKFLFHQKIRHKISGRVLGDIFTYDSIVWVLSSIFTLMSVFWQIKAQLLNSCKDTQMLVKLIDKSHLPLIV